MRLALTCDEIVVEVRDDKERYSPDVLDDWCTRVGRLMQEQRALTICLNQSTPHVPGE